jgi:hypothetical protein
MDGSSFSGLSTHDEIGSHFRSPGLDLDVLAFANLVALHGVGRIHFLLI